MRVLINLVPTTVRVLHPVKFIDEPVAFEPSQRDGRLPVERESPFHSAAVVIFAEKKFVEVEFA